MARLRHQRAPVRGASGGSTVVAAERLHFRLCGQLRVSSGDGDLDLAKTARQGRVVAAYLALNHDRVVARDELMERVFTEPDPRRAGASLSQTLSRLRSIFGRERLERLPGRGVC